MKKFDMGYLCKSALILTALSCLPIISPLSAEPTTDECSKELLLAYFPEVFVRETLKKFNVPEDQWSAIQVSLNSKDKEVIKIVEDKAQSMNPNPLKDSQSRQIAVKLFRETLYRVFADVMNAHGITDSKQIQAMLDDIQQRKAQRFARCMQRPESKHIEPVPAEIK